MSGMEGCNIAVSSKKLILLLIMKNDFLLAYYCCWWCRVGDSRGVLLMLLLLLEGETLGGLAIRVEYCYWKGRHRVGVSLIECYCCC